MTPSVRPVVLAVGHLPPPVHGMAVATERLIELIAARAEVKVLPISGRSLRGSARHLTRSSRTLLAMLRLVIERHRSDALYVGSDAGLGMCYTLAVVLAGTLLGYRTFLHHHSAAYVNRWSALMASIVRIGGRRCRHVLSCSGQAAAFDARYRPRQPSTVVPISYALPAQAKLTEITAGAARRPDAPGLTLGHLSNLSVEKGLERVFQTLHVALAAGLDVNLLVAGPPGSPRDEVVLRRLLTEAGPRASYLGPADENLKRRFFEEIDVFLFPSRYRHESFGLVAGEAMQAGIPLIAYRAGCLDTDLVRGAGLVLEPTEEFAAAAVRQLRRWHADPAQLHACASIARERADSCRDDALASASAFIEMLAGAARPG